MSQLAIASQFLGFASKSESQALLVNDASMMKTMISFLDSEDDKVVIASIESLYHLSLPEHHRQRLVAIPGLITKVAKVVSVRDDQSIILNLAQKTLDNLTGEINGNVPIHTGKRTERFGVRGYMHNVNIFIKEMKDEKNRCEVEKAIIDTKGVVSVTIDKATKQAILTCAHDQASMLPRLSYSLDQAGFSCELYKDTRPSYQDKENASSSNGDKPGYISKEGAGKKGSLINVNDSLRSRLAKGKGKKEEESSGFFASVTSYFW